MPNELKPHRPIFLFAGQFGCFEWSHAETHLLYIAEKKRPKAKSFFDKKAVAESLTKNKDELSLVQRH